MAYTNELYHHGILGQKWGVRRYQNEDGSYTEAGKRRYGYIEKAALKAKKYSEYAKDNKNKFSNMKPHGEVTKDDIQRWTRVSKKQEAEYSALYKKYSTIKLDRIDKKTLKEAKSFAEKAFYTDADYSDYYTDGKWRNYQE